MIKLAGRSRWYLRHRLHANRQTVDKYFQLSLKYFCEDSFQQPCDPANIRNYPHKVAVRLFDLGLIDDIYTHQEQVNDAIMEWLETSKEFEIKSIKYLEYEFGLTIVDTGEYKAMSSDELYDAIEFAEDLKGEIKAIQRSSCKSCHCCGCSGNCR
jgi:hypothetical protein